MNIPDPFPGCPNAIEWLEKEWNTNPDAAFALQFETQLGDPVGFRDRIKRITSGWGEVFEEVYAEMDSPDFVRYLAAKMGRN
jgi:hypothetical protein